MKVGANHTFLGYKFGIDTDGADCVCYKYPSYGPNEYNNSDVTTP